MANVRRQSVLVVLTCGVLAGAVLVCGGCGGSARREFSSIRSAMVLPSRAATERELAMLDTMDALDAFDAPFYDARPVYASVPTE